MKLYTGTSGWAYKEWKGPFYPEKLKNDAMLAYYSERLPAVEAAAFEVEQRFLVHRADRRGVATADDIGGQDLEDGVGVRFCRTGEQQVAVGLVGVRARGALAHAGDAVVHGPRGAG